jgi:hypothetical protein
MEAKQDVLRRVLASLSAQKQNLPKADPTEEVYVADFHKQLDALERAGYDVAEFRVSSSQFKPIDISSGIVTTGIHEPTRYSPDKYVARSLLLTRIDTVLSYFALESGGKQIGFTA